MGLAVFFTVLAKVFNVFAWPSFALIYPLYASIQAIESDSYFKNEQCLTYWILFSLATMLELVFAKLLQCIPFWPHAKGVATFLLVIHYFQGASYVYQHFVSPSISGNLQICCIFSILRKKDDIWSEPDNFLDAAERYIEENGPEELEKLLICQENHEPYYHTTERNLTLSTSPMKAQREWSCALCLITTSSEKHLKNHLQGKEHKAKEEEEERANELVRKTKVKSSLTLDCNDPMVLLNNFNGIALLNLERLHNLLTPVARSIRWYSWEKPEFGWTKLNTDGSIDRENAGFGGLLRNYNGDPICAYVSKAHQNDIFLVELWAIWRGLVLASGLGIKAIWVESDSLSVVKTINKKQPYSSRAGSCLNHTWVLLEKFEKYRVSHTWRETNKAADFLSRMDLSGSDVVLGTADFPNGLNSIIKDDAEGRMYRRG